MEDSIYKWKKYYDHSPAFLKKVVGNLYRQIPLPFRYGTKYKYYRDLLTESKFWSKQKLEEYQMQRLEKLLRHVYENVPYYRRVFDEREIKPEDIQNLSDFKNIPYLTKEIVRNNIQDLIARNYPKHKLLYQTTGGSTGAPLTFYHEKSVARSKEVAFFEALWSRVGYRWGRDRMISLRGETVKAKDNKFWEYEPIRNNLIFSVYHMTNENLPYYIERIKTFEPRFIYTYPSAITLLAIFMRNNDIGPFNCLKAILCGSEHLFPQQQHLLEETFNCKILNWYGMGEKVTLAGSCEHSSYYHIFPEYGITELIGENGRAVCEEDKVGEIIGTSFDNDIMPFIRYKTGDLGVHTNQKCKCGRNYPLIKCIEGRVQEFIVSKDGSLISLNGNMISLDSALFSIKNEGWRKIKQIQFIQEEKGKLTLRVVKDDRFSLLDATEYVKSLFEKRLRYLCEFKIEFVDDIPRTDRGKHRFLIQKMPIEFTLQN